MEAATRKEPLATVSTVPKRRPWLRWALVMVVLIAQTGCRGAGELTDRMVPRQWRGNPWGPEAESARRCGQLPTIPFSPPMTVWDAWGRQNLRDGDILFRMGDARAACGLFPFSKISAAMAGSRYSHTGIVAWEEGMPMVYDTTTTGPRRQPFAIWLLDTAGGFAVKRPAPACQGHVPAAVAFCRGVYLHQVPFDRGLTLGDDRLYCIELTERAYRSAGLPLSRPMRIEQLPRFQEFPNIVRLARLFSPLEPGQEAYIIGNAEVGIWSSPVLDLIYEAPDARLPHGPPSQPAESLDLVRATHDPRPPG